MTAISYLLKRTKINSLKELKKHPLKLVSYILFLALIVFYMVKGKEINQNTWDNSIQIFNGIFLVLTSFLVLSAIKNGNEKGSSLFRMADVNFLFPAPIKSQKILIYGFIQQIFTSLIFVLVVIFQIPNIHMFFPVQNYGGILIAGNVFLLNFLCGILSIFIYSIGSLKANNKKIIKSILYGSIFLFALGAIYNIFKSGDIVAGILDYLNMPFFKYIPIIGWILNIFNSAIYGANFNTLIYAILTMGFSGLLIFILYRLDLDYYEDVLDTTLTKEELFARAKEGKTGYNPKLKIRKVKGNIKYTGAKAILSKQILEAKKTGLVFANLTTLITAVVAFIYAYFSRNKNIISLLYMLTYMNLLLLSTTTWAMELKNHYIFLIPEPSRKKVFYATFLEVLKSFINGIIIFTIAAIMFKENLFLGIIMAITYTSFSALILYSDLILRRILGGKLNVLVERFLRFLIIIIFILPGIILSFIAGSKFNLYIGRYGEYLILIIYNILISSLFIFLSKGIFERIEMD